MEKKLLEALDLNASEIAVYNAVITSGGVTPADLAKRAGLKRTTAYSVAHSLLEKGLLVEDATRRPRVFTAASPEHVLSLIDSEKKKLVTREAALKRVAAELSTAVAGSHYPVPTVRFVEEDKIESFLRQQSPEWDRSLLEVDPTWWGFFDQTFLDEYMGWLDWYWERVPDGIYVKVLTNHTPQELEATRRYGKYGRRETKFWGEVTDFRSSFWALGDYMLMVNTRTRPFYMVEIHDKLMAHDQREVFKDLWKRV